jgi:hypothetical protein
MNIENVTQFFMWCTIINLGIYIFWVLFVLLAPDFVYRLQTKWIPISRDTFNVLMYSFMGAFKVVIIVFCCVPYLSLVIIGG